MLRICSEPQDPIPNDLDFSLHPLEVGRPMYKFRLFRFASAAAKQSVKDIFSPLQLTSLVATSLVGRNILGGRGAGLASKAIRQDQVMANEHG